MSDNTLSEPTNDPGNAIIAHTLHWLAVLLEIDEQEPARVAAYRQAAFAVRQLDRPVSEVVKGSGARALEVLGIEPAVAVMIADWLRTGELPVLAATQKNRPGLWPALSRALCKTLGIEPAEAPLPRRSAPRPSRPPNPGPIHRAVWESWN